MAPKTKKKSKPKKHIDLIYELDNIDLTANLPPEFLHFQLNILEHLREALIIEAGNYFEENKSMKKLKANMPLILDISETIKMMSHEKINKM